MKIQNIGVYGLEQSIIASSYPKRSETLSEVKFQELVQTLTEVNDRCFTSESNQNEEEINNHYKRVKVLSNAKLGSGHNCFLKGVIVQYDLTAPEFFWRQFDRYHFHDYVSSESKMHRLTKFDIDKISNKYVSRGSINELNYWIDLYNKYPNSNEVDIRLRDGSKIPYTKENIFQMAMSNCPMGLELTARITDNYLQLKSKYHQRKHHKLEQWQEYCRWIETLPLAKELIIGGE